MRRIALLAAGLFAAVATACATAAPASAAVQPPQPDPIIIVDE